MERGQGKLDLKLGQCYSLFSIPFIVKNCIPRLESFPISPDTYSIKLSTLDDVSSKLLIASDRQLSTGRNPSLNGRSMLRLKTGLVGLEYGLLHFGDICICPSLADAVLLCHGDWAYLLCEGVMASQRRLVKVSVIPHNEDPSAVMMSPSFSLNLGLDISHAKLIPVARHYKPCAAASVTISRIYCPRLVRDGNANLQKLVVRYFNDNMNRAFQVGDCFSFQVSGK